MIFKIGHQDKQGSGTTCKGRMQDKTWKQSKTGKGWLKDNTDKVWYSKRKANVRYKKIQTKVGNRQRRSFHCVSEIPLN